MRLRNLITFAAVMAYWLAGAGGVAHVAGAAGWYASHPLEVIAMVLTGATLGGLLALSGHPVHRYFLHPPQR